MLLLCICTILLFVFIVFSLYNIRQSAFCPTDVISVCSQTPLLSDAFLPEALFLLLPFILNSQLDSPARVVIHLETCMPISLILDHFSQVFFAISLFPLMLDNSILV